MLKVILFLFFTLSVIPSFSGTAVHIKGVVTKVEKGEVFIKNNTGTELRIPLKSLNSSDQKAVNESIASKKPIELIIDPKVLEK